MFLEFKSHNRYHWFSYLIYAVFISLQLWLLIDLQLFGDEAFYWLEGQHLGLSYTELPGWTAWMTRLGTEIFGHNYFAVRIISYLGFISIFWAIWLINKNILGPKQYIHLNILLLMSMPIVVLIAVMALPDVWLMVFVIWLSYFFIKACSDNLKKQWVIIGLLMACSLNVHVRMWIWLFVACLVFLFVFYSQIK
ncbi:MAG: glycosyltransferase family 39 protein, partial [Alcanivoracaceae bacterium]|nr:glycosyltransferase family 39 protein [Alcanivoracaceae bacterium]